MDRLGKMNSAVSSAVVARQLSRSFGGVHAVRGLDLDVPRGTMFGLVGPDGAGKSTAIRLFCGLLKPDAGTVWILGLDQARDAALIKTRIGYLSQNFTLYGDLTVDENVAFFARIHGVSGWRKRRNELLEMTGLAPFRKRLGQNLSGGMKKKLALACTLVHTPELLFLDEPSTGVDPVSRGEFWNLLGGMVDSGMTVFLTTPYLDEAERCDAIGLMHRGSIVNAGTPAEIKGRMRGRIVALSCPQPGEAYRALRARFPASRLVMRGGTVRFRAYRDDGEAAELVAMIERAGVCPVIASDAEPTLEDAFIEMIANDGSVGENAA